MNIKSETIFTKLSPKVAVIRCSVYVDDKLFDDMTILKGPIAEVQAYYEGKLTSLEDVKRIWRTKPRHYFYCTSLTDSNIEDVCWEDDKDENKRTYSLSGVEDGTAYILGADLMMLSNLPSKPIYAIQ